MKCPACSAVVPDKSAECPGCGVDFAKWRARAEALDLRPPSSGPSPAAGSKTGLGPVVGMVACLAVGGSLAYVRSRVGKSAAAAPAAPAAPKGLPPAGPSPSAPGAAGSGTAPAGKARSMDGYQSVWDEYSARAASLGLEPRESEAKRFFEIGVSEGEGLSYEIMEDLGYKSEDLPFSEEEKRTLAPNVWLRCEGPSGVEYPTSLPTNGDLGGRRCWGRKHGHAKSTAQVIVISSPDMPFAEWALLTWQPGLRQWSAWEEGQYLDAIRRNIERNYGPDKLEELKRAAEQRLARLTQAGKPDPRDAGEALFEAYRSRFRREGALAELERKTP